jgi:3,4-dihydroxyphenylacetate 2,3-dioxygenase
MAGGLIASGVAVHTPRIGVEEKAPAFARGMIAGSREMGEAIRALEPDLIVLHSAHWVSTFNWYVTGHAVHEGVCIADEAPDLIPGSHYRRPGDPEFARLLAAVLNDAGVPCGINDAEHYTWDYATLVPTQYIDPGSTIPLVTMPSVLCSELDECLNVGRLVAQAAEKTGRRVAYLSSCALSHKVIRGPELWPTEERQAMDHKLIELMCKGEVGQLIDWLPTYAQDAVAEMGGRPIATLVGALDALAKTSGALEGRQFGPYGQSSGSGNANVCVFPKTAH